MPTIATLTMNPTIDVAYEVNQVRHTHKMRGRKANYDPGGGGINVARVFGRLQGNANCYYLSGGAAGAMLDVLLNQRCFVRKPIQIAGNTRIATNIFERSTGHEFRFVPPGPEVTAAEADACLSALAEAEGQFLVASGSLPPGVPVDFYAKVGEIARKRGIRMVLDSSGDALRAGLSAGNVYLVKPSESELAGLVGRDLDTVEEIESAALQVVESGQAEMVAVTLGANGAMLVSNTGSLFLPSLKVEVKSATGAGDSFLAAMLYRLAVGDDPPDAFRYGMAAGAAAAITAGTDLCFPEDIERFHAQYADIAAS
ncbi:6-phosphofructokinase 2 [Altererythrobacter atlanticus]|uniref:Phosphofructokinase n=1 Tax=Croceibacterium atlanticum TaxID=1267766 RepID=A0A0F7KV82_9SPHN|nr:1-phosphofructokinase family hexose kinase [Croceibacterium atlanticum]AKH43142.1 Putative phosphofructokinase PfkB [Croceibacterium atlanticum]MBB5732154.1 6-phosphofructokinase 2 [Croceibacterium atlanticum]